ncbi:protease SohB [Pseudohaliea rubra]|uniref:Putative protease sohB n=1 Tax=Pseudohaliea rubra DSM 19751 TaxID=1265313 RepID=A0A095WY26_9GAMM|nr:protease SohB [Pseudohaliea rubra]KGE03534.1 putative protease sohB [Pseudohaliea rubra DSM 19751]
MEFLSEVGLFLAQAISVVLAALLLVLGIAVIAQRQKKGDSGGHLEVHKLHERYRQQAATLAEALDPIAAKASAKARRKAEKAAAKARKKASRDGEGGRERPVSFVLDFDGDLRATAAGQLREEVSAVLAARRDGDDVILRLESPGGIVHGYGLAASQLQRLRDAGMPLTVCVDKVAASGGYMMACVAERIVAAPFAVLGSIGVVAQLPNFHRLLKKHEVDVELLTAGEYKRTLTLFGENTDKGRQKFQQELEDTHELFKLFVRENRPALDVDAVATGEIWYGRRALEAGLVDELSTSDALLTALATDRDLIAVHFVERRSWQDRLGIAAEAAVTRAILRLWQRGLDRRQV